MEPSKEPKLPAPKFHLCKSPFPQPTCYWYSTEEYSRAETPKEPSSLEDMIIDILYRKVSRGWDSRDSLYYRYAYTKEELDAEVNRLKQRLCEQLVDDFYKREYSI